MFQRLAHFANIWRLESATTGRVLGRITEAALHVRAAPEGRSVGETAWHIACAIRDIGGLMGLPLSGPERGDTMATTAAEIRAAYEGAAEELLTLVQSKWTDETLRVRDDVYGENWERGRTLYTLIAHEIHHRGQLTTLLRVAGLTIPWVYGPSRDERDPPAHPS